MLHDLNDDLTSTWRRAADAWRTGDALPVLHPALLWGDEPRGDSSKLRVGLITDTYLPVANGVTHMVSLLARTLVKQGHEPHVFTFAAPGAVRATLRDHDGIAVHHARALPISRSGYYFGVRYPLRMKLLMRGMDVLHVHHPFISGRLVWRVARPEQPLVFTNHTRYDIYGHYVQQWMPFVAEDMVQDRLTHSAARFANRCDCVISPSASVALLLRDWGVRSPIETVPNGINLQKFREASNARGTSNQPRTDLRRKLSIEAGAPVALYLGRLTPEKNVAHLLEAFAQALPDVPAASLVLAGDGPSEGDLKQLVRRLNVGGSIRFTGAIKYDDVPALFSACDVFASASVSEVHPLTFIEAMASGLPCVGIRSPGVSDTVTDGVNGWLTDPGITNLAAALLEALANPSICRLRGMQAGYDSQAYAIERTTDRTLEIYQQSIALRRELSNPATTGAAAA